MLIYFGIFLTAKSSPSRLMRYLWFYFGQKHSKNIQIAASLPEKQMTEGFMTDQDHMRHFETHQSDHLKRKNGDAGDSCFLVHL